MKNYYSATSLFAGVGGIESGFERTGRFKTDYANEFDPYARTTYHSNHLSTPLDGRDVHQVSPDDIPNSDIIVGGFPCQAFSIAGHRQGFQDDRGNLFFEMLRIIRAKRPRAIFIENVKNLVTHDHGRTFQVIRGTLVKAGYHLKWQVLNTKEYGNVPQNRDRIYLVGFRNEKAFRAFQFPAPISLTTSLRDVIDFSGHYDEKYYYRQGKQKYYPLLKRAMTSQRLTYQWRRNYVRKNAIGILPTLTANMGMGGSNTPLIRTDSGEIRKLTPQETFWGQGFPTDFRIPPQVSNSQLYRQAGNAVSLPVVKRIATRIAKALDES